MQTTVLKTLTELWRDESGAVLGTEFVLVTTTLGISMIVGLTNVRNALVQELSNTASAVGNLNQSYHYSGIEGPTSWTAGGAWIDTPDTNEGGSPTYGVDVTVPGIGEEG